MKHADLVLHLMFEGAKPIRLDISDWDGELTERLRSHRLQSIEVRSTRYQAEPEFLQRWNHPGG